MDERQNFYFLVFPAWDYRVYKNIYEIYCGICESITIARQEKTNERGLLALEEKIAGCVSKRWHEYDIPGTVKY